VTALWDKETRKLRHTKMQDTKSLPNKLTAPRETPQKVPEKVKRSWEMTKHIAESELTSIDSHEICNTGGMRYYTNWSTLGSGIPRIPCTNTNQTSCTPTSSG
jgi:hypothetical protein